MVRTAIRSIRDRLAPDPSGYECGVCGLTFDREPHNCPACGNPDVVPA